MCLLFDSCTISGLRTVTCTAGACATAAIVNNIEVR